MDRRLKNKLLNPFQNVLLLTAKIKRKGKYIYLKKKCGPHHIFFWTFWKKNRPPKKNSDKFQQKGLFFEIILSTLCMKTSFCIKQWGLLCLKENFKKNNAKKRQSAAHFLSVAVQWKQHAFQLVHCITTTLTTRIVPSFSSSYWTRALRTLVLSHWVPPTETSSLLKFLLLLQPTQYYNKPVTTANFTVLLGTN